MAPVADEQLAACGAVFYDCETQNLVPSEGVARDPRFTYCGGWNDYTGMGISTIAAYDFSVGEYMIFMADNLDKFRQLVESRDVIMGFNNHRFDDNLIAAHGIDLPRARSYDLWRQIVDTQPPGSRFGFSLNEMLKANGLELKSGSGGDAPKLAQTGQWGHLINYNLGDVSRSVRILRLVCADMLRNPKSTGYLKVAKPWEIITKEPGDALF